MGEKKRGIDGKLYQDKDIAGYCAFAEHCGVLTEKHLTERGCIEKDCPHFEIYFDAPYWTKIRERFSTDIKDRRARKRYLFNLSKRALLMAREYTAAFESLWCINARAEGTDKIIISYTDRESVSLTSVSKLISSNLGTDVYFIYVKVAYEKYIEMIEAKNAAR